MPKFEKGTSGNPAGRPKRIATHAVLREAIERAAPEIVQTLIEQATAGDTAAAKLLLDRTIPALRPSDATVTLPPAVTLAERGQAILDAVSAGEIPPDVASVLLHGVQIQAKLVETTELIERIERLEAKQ